jgi:hypothetical protein
LTYSPWTPTAAGASLSSQGSSTASNTGSFTVSSTASSTVCSLAGSTTAACSKASGADSGTSPGQSTEGLEGLGHLSLNPRPSSSAAYRTSSHQPGICWLPGGLMVKQGEVYPLVASHNTVR